MATAFLRMKWQKTFKSYDINQDNVITVEDADIFSGNFARNHNLKEEDAAIAKTKARTYWKEWVLQGLEVADEKTYLENKEKAYVKNPAEFRANARKYFALIIDIIDVNKDKRISEREFEIMAKSTGFKHYDNKYMKAYPQTEDGYISLNVYLDAFVEFTCNPDKYNIEVEKPRLVGYGIEQSDIDKI